MSVLTLKRKKGMVYKAIVYGNNGRQLAKIFDRKADAQSWERDTWSQIKKGPLNIVKLESIDLQRCFERWLKECAEAKLELSSIARYKRYFNFQILPTFGSRKLNKISESEINLWFVSMVTKQGLSRKTANECLSFLKRLLKFSVKKKYLAISPAEDIDLAKLPERNFEFWTKGESQKFLTFMKPIDYDFYCICFAALTTGMRLGELLGLKFDCVSFERRQITVRRSLSLEMKQIKETTKTKKNRIVPVNNSLHQLLCELKLASRSEFVFKDRDGGHFATRLRAYAPKADVKSISFHDLRHSFASQFMMAGGNIYDLQKILGHSSIQMTERYSHLSPTHLNGVTECLNY